MATADKHSVSLTVESKTLLADATAAVAQRGKPQRTSREWWATGPLARSRRSEHLECSLRSPFADWTNETPVISVGNCGSRGVGSNNPAWCMAARSALTERGKGDPSIS